LLAILPVEVRVAIFPSRPFLVEVNYCRTRIHTASEIASSLRPLWAATIGLFPKNLSSLLAPFIIIDAFVTCWACGLADLDDRLPYNLVWTLHWIMDHENPRAHVMLGLAY